MSTFCPKLWSWENSLVSLIDIHKNEFYSASLLIYSDSMLFLSASHTVYSASTIIYSVSTSIYSVSPILFHTKTLEWMCSKANLSSFRCAPVGVGLFTKMRFIPLRQLFIRFHPFINIYFSPQKKATLFWVTV